MTNLNLNLYRVFYTVAKRGSLTKAAEELYISQPAVSQAIRQLETQLGVSLFNRTHRGLELSERGGKVIYSKVEQALKAFSEAENSLQQLSDKASGTLRIAATSNIFEYFLVDKIAAFYEQYPEVKIELITTLPNNVEAALLGDKCDVAFVHLPVDEAAASDVVVYGNVMRINDIFVTNKDNLELTKGPIPLNRLQDYPLIMLEKKTLARTLVEDFFTRLGIELKPSIEVDDFALMKKLVTSGMGIGIVPREYAKRRLRDGLLFEIKTEPPLPARSVGIVLKKEAKISFALRKFLDLFDLEV